jgi:hypothetical protein
MDYVDLWLVHWPPRGRALVSTWQELLAARDAGLARAVGVSNYSIRELDQVTRATGQAPQVNQIPWAPALYDAALLAQHRERGVVLEGYSPFKNTDLRHPVLAKIAADHGVTPAQVVVRWHVDHQVVVIPKSATPERIAANFDVFGFSLTEEELRRSRLPSGWTPLALLKHLAGVERRWFRWGFAGERVDDPDVEHGPLQDTPRPGTAFNPSEPHPALIWILFHVLQEYARHAGHLDVARELADGTVGQ